MCTSIYQKQMAGLSALPADLHQGALLHKDLFKNHTEKPTSHDTHTHARPFTVASAAVESGVARGFPAE